MAAPLFHAAGSIAVLATVWNGGRQVVLPVFDPPSALDLVEQHGVTDTLVVPTMLAALNDEQAASRATSRTLRAICHGGSPVATETLRRAHAAFPGAELVHIYGATETVADRHHAARRGDAARHAPDAFLRPARRRRRDRRSPSPTGRRLPTGEVGEVAVRGART